MSSTASQKGFGLELIERSLPYELDAKTRVALAGAGARIELEIPARLKGMSWVRGDRTPAP